MITPILEKMLLSGEATLRRITVMGSSQWIIPALENKTNVITKIVIHPFVSQPVWISGAVSDANTALEIFPISATDPSDTSAKMLQLAQRSVIQLQIRNKYGSSYFIVKPEISIGNPGGTGPIVIGDTSTYMIGEFKYSRQDNDCFVMFDSDQYIDLCVLGNADISLQAASTYWNSTTPTGAEPTTLTLQSDVKSQNSFVAIDAGGFGILRPAADKYLAAAIANANNQTEFQSFGNSAQRPFVLVALQTEADVKYVTKLFMPYIDLEIVTINEKSALKAIKEPQPNVTTLLKTLNDSIKALKR